MQTRIILASGSPRRLELLRLTGMDPQVIVPDLDETPRRGESPSALVKRLARAKAQAVHAMPSAPTGTIVAADTIVVAPTGRILGKPIDSNEAASFLKLLSGRTHTVYTGYCILSPRSTQRPLVRSIRTRVTLRKLTARQIAEYVATGEPLDKAGAYAAQGMGMALIRSIQGSYTNVIGLPLAEVVDDLLT